MPNYVDIVGKYFPGVQVYTAGDPQVYANLVWSGAPIAQATLDAQLVGAKETAIVQIIDRLLDADDYSITSAGPNNTYIFTVPGDTLGLTKILRLKLAGMWSNNAGASRTVTITVTYGGQTIYSDTSPTLATGAKVGWDMEWVMLNSMDMTNLQKITGCVRIGSTGAVATGQTGDMATDEIMTHAQTVGAFTTVNSSANQILAVTVTFNGSGIVWTKYYHTLELL